MRRAKIALIISATAVFLLGFAIYRAGVIIEIDQVTFEPFPQEDLEEIVRDYPMWHVKEEQSSDFMLELVGEVFVHGEVNRHPMLGLYCLDKLDENSENIIPRVGGDNRYPWVCFRNYEKAEAELRSRDTYEMLIADYTLDRRETETTDSVVLVEVLNQH